MEPKRAEIIGRIMQRVACMQDRPQTGPWDNWSRIDLTVQQIKTLAALWGHPALRMRALSELLGVNLSTMTGIIDRLVERNFVERGSDPEDRRIVLVQLSDAGRDEIGHIMRLGQAQFEALLEFIATDDLPIVAQAMDIMFTASEAFHARAMESKERGPHQDALEGHAPTFGDMNKPVRVTNA
jgi:DNA-binding MarR family transcriptional regulator